MIQCSNRLTKKEFHDSPDAYLKQFATWSDIPRFALLVGPNGSGKSKILIELNQFKNSQLHYADNEQNTSDLLEKFIPIGSESSRAINDLNFALSEALNSVQRNMAGFTSNRKKVNPQDPAEFIRYFLCNQKTLRSLRASEKLKYLRSDQINQQYELTSQPSVSSNQQYFTNDFWSSFNSDLAKLGFKYQFVLIPSPGNTDQYEVYLKSNDNALYKEVSLSSGEAFILNVLTWQWTFSKNDNTTCPVELMLLDEPDRHLDPKMCRVLMKIIKLFVAKNIQVIMSSHRVDTVSLAPAESIFTICQNVDGKK